MQIELQQLKQRFQEIFCSNHEPIVVLSPGRVNIIGYHTDYNDGFVLPAAIDKAAWVAVSARNAVSYTHLDVYKRQVQVYTLPAIYMASREKLICICLMQNPINGGFLKFAD